MYEYVQNDPVNNLDPSGLQNIKNRWNKITPYSYSQTAYLLVEGGGIHGTYSISGTAVVSYVNGKWIVKVNAIGHTSMIGAGDVFFRGSASLIVNGKVVSTHQFEKQFGPSITMPIQQDIIGATTFTLPETGNVQISVEGIYSFGDPSGGTTPTKIFPNNAIIQLSKHNGTKITCP